MKCWIETDEQRDRFVKMYPQCENICRYNLPLGVMVNGDDWNWFAAREDYNAAVANEISQQATTNVNGQLESYTIYLPSEYTLAKHNGITMPDDAKQFDAVNRPRHTPSDEDDFDVVNRPRHYADSKVECIDAMAAALGKEAVASFALCNTFKYLWRRDGKGGDEDVRKALWYFDKYKELVNE